MSQKVTVELVDDLDQSKADETILFAVGDSSYEIDLSKSNADKFQKALKPFVEAARAGSAPRGPGRPRKAVAKRAGGATEDYPRETVRIWARSKGMAVGDRGRIKASIVQEWKEAGSPEA